MYPRELCHLTKGFTPIKASRLMKKMKEGLGVIQLHLNNSSASSTPMSHLSSTTGTLVGNGVAGTGVGALVGNGVAGTGGCDTVPTS